MAYVGIHNTGLNFRQFVAQTFVTVGDVLVRLAEANSMAQAADRVAQMSDCQLASEGLTRAAAIKKVFVKYNYL
ncbi:MAG: hypothetical protein ACSHWQ_09280 [Spongiibacteraceae bacterium]